MLRTLLVAAVFLESASAFSGSGLALTSHMHQFSPIRSSLRERKGVCGAVMMSKGKGIPINMRGEYQKRSQMEQTQRQMMGFDKDGLPVFTLYTRSKVAKLW
jgi:hypothetical protein